MVAPRPPWALRDHRPNLPDQPHNTGRGALPGRPGRRQQLGLRRSCRRSREWPPWHRLFVGLWRLTGEPFEFYLPTHELRTVNAAVITASVVHRCAPMPTTAELDGEEQVILGCTPVIF